MSSNKKRVLSGMRPTGRLHLGNILGALSNWVAMQDEFDCFYMVADFHFLTTEYAQAQHLRRNTEEMVKDFLAVGISTDKTVLFRQSDVSAHAYLHLLFSMIVPLSWLERNPTYKEQLRELAQREVHTYGFLGYPVLQAADILLYQAHFVPVGEDQLAHLELCREIVRRFHHLYKEGVFVEPLSKVSLTPKVPGLDSRKMSKSYNNAITLSDRGESLQRKVMTMFTDPKKIRKDDYGHPEGCVVFAFHKIYNRLEAQTLETDCRQGSIGCVACKKRLSLKMSEKLAPLWEARDKVEKADVEGILKEGSKKANQVAQETLAKAREAIGL